MLNNRTDLAATIGQAARKSRRELRLSKVKAADRIGISGALYARIEDGEAMPDVPMLVSIAHELRLSLDVVFGFACGSSEQMPEPLDVRSVVAKLRKASPRQLHLVRLLLGTLDESDKPGSSSSSSTGS